jgi:hypothetical protein
MVIDRVLAQFYKITPASSKVMPLMCHIKS